MDFVFTLYDNAAADVGPVWRGQPMTAHWGAPDPAVVPGDEVAKMMAFRQAFRELENRIKIFVSLPLASLDRLKLQQQLDAIGQVRVGRPALFDRLTRDGACGTGGRSRLPHAPNGCAVPAESVERPLQRMGYSAAQCLAVAQGATWASAAATPSRSPRSKPAAPCSIWAGAPVSTPSLPLDRWEGPRR